VSSVNEDKRLSSSEDGWKLAGIKPTSGRTRGSAAALPNPDVGIDMATAGTAATTTTAPARVIHNCDTSTISTLTEPVIGSPFVKTRHQRGIVEVNPLRALVDRHLQGCPECGSKLEVTFPTEGIASGTRIACANQVGGCVHVAAAPPAQSDFDIGDGRIKAGRNSDCALNVCYVLAFVQSGDGGTEAARVLGLCGLPNSTTMQSRTFGTIESAIYPTTEGMTERMLFSNLKAEVALAFGDQVNEDGAKSFDLWVEKKLPPSEWPVICCGGDMGWSQKGSGRTFNSNSGHAMFIANLTRKPVAKHTCCKACKKCKTWYCDHGSDEDVPQHYCLSNFDGSSGSMEPEPRGNA